MLAGIMVARPLIKYGILVGVPVALLIASHTYAFFKGDARGDARAEKRVLAEWNAANDKVVKESNKQLLAMQVLEARLADEKAKDAQIIAQQAALLKRKAYEYAKSKPSTPLSSEFRDLYDGLRRLPNEAGVDLSSSDSRTGGEEIPSGEVRASTAGVLPLADETDPITTDALYQAVVHTYETLADCKADYQDFSRWNDGREQIELDRLRSQQ